MKQKTNDEMKRNAKFVRRGLCFSLAPPIYFLLLARIMCSSFTFVESLSTVRWSSFRPFSGTCYSITVLIKRIISGLIKITVRWMSREQNWVQYSWLCRMDASRMVVELSKISERNVHSSGRRYTRSSLILSFLFFFFFLSNSLNTSTKKRQNKSTSTSK